MHRGYSPAWDLADRQRNRFDVESYDVYEFHGDNNGDPDSGASDDQTSVSGAAGASVSMPDCAPDDPACHPHRAFQSFQYPGYGPSVPPGYPHGPFVEPDMGYDGAPPPPGGYGGRPQGPGGYGGGYGGRPGAPRGGIVEALRRGFGGRPNAPQSGIPGPGWVSADGTPWNKSWEKWQMVHQNRGDNTFTNYTQWRDGVGQDPNADIHGDVSFGDEDLGDLGGMDLCGGLDMRG
ncbi:MAG: hypothetical protein ACHREM_16675 [Polyangiales bacterium]